MLYYREAGVPATMFKIRKAKEEEPTAPGQGKYATNYWQEQLSSLLGIQWLKPVFFPPKRH